MAESKTLKKCQVHCLDTKKSTLLHNIKVNKFEIYTGDYQGKSNMFTPMHLYITSDEVPSIEGDKYFNTEIKDGVYNPSYGKIYTATTNILKKQGYNDPHYYDKWMRKIIATTDPELFFQATEMETWAGPDKIPEDFITAYVREQGIKEVMVEYEWCGTEDKGVTSIVERKDTSGFGFYTGERPKLRPNGTIIIHPVKEKTYTRVELHNALWNIIYEHTEMDYATFNKWFVKSYPE